MDNLSPDSINNNDEKTDKQVSINDDDTWIKDYLMPKLISDAKIFNLTNMNVNDDDNTSPCHNPNKIQVVSVNVKPVSIDGFMLSAPCKVEIEFSYEVNGDDGGSGSGDDKCEAGSKSQQVVFDKVYLVVKVGVIYLCVKKNIDFIHEIFSLSVYK